jgi:hypothetical protein
MAKSHQFLDVPIVYLAPFGRGGSIFIQGLFDRHPQVSVIPCLFPFLDLVSRDPSKTFKRCADLFRVEIEERYGCVLNFAMLEKSFFEFVSEFRQLSPGRSFKEIQLRAIHFAWTKQCGNSTEDTRVIVWHPHRLDDDYKTFLRSLAYKRILLACRSPLDSLISTYQHWAENDMLPMPPADTSDYVRHPWIILYLNKSYETFELYEEFNDLVCTVAIEHLNADVEGETRRVSEFLGIDFKVEFLGQSTCMGLPMQQLPGKSVKPISSRAKFQGTIPVNTELLMSRLFGPAAQAIGYPASNQSRTYAVGTLVVWLVFSGVWKLAFAVCIDEGRRGSTRAGAGRLGTIFRACNYYMQFLREFSKLICRLVSPPLGSR